MKFALIVFALAPVLLASSARSVAAQEPETPTTSQPAQDNSAVPNIAGNWQASWTAINGSQRQATTQIKQNGSKLSGAFQVEQGSTRLI